MTLCPTWFESRVWNTPRTPVTIGMTTIPATRTVSRPTSSCRIATSSTREKKRGDDTERCRDEDQARDRRQSGAVRSEETDDAAEVRGA